MSQVRAVAIKAAITATAVGGSSVYRKHASNNNTSTRSMKTATVVSSHITNKPVVKMVKPSTKHSTTSICVALADLNKHKVQSMETLKKHSADNVQPCFNYGAEKQNQSDVLQTLSVPTLRNALSAFRGESTTTQPAAPVTVPAAFRTIARINI